MPISKIVRRWIDEEYEEHDREQRIAAAERLCAMEIEDVPDPEELNRQAESTYGVPALR